MYNKLFEDMNTQESKGKFTFDLIGKYSVWNTHLIKLNANGTTGYPVYYLYMSDNKQSYVIRIIKQERKCKLLSAGNPKLIWNFVNDIKSKFPTKKESTIECFASIFNTNIQQANVLLKWINKQLNTNITLKDFGISDNITTTNTTVRPSSSVEKPASNPVDLSEKKKQLIIKLIKEDIAEAKKSKYVSTRNYIVISAHKFYVKHEKELKKYYTYPDSYMAEEAIENDFYKLDIYAVPMPGFTKDYYINKPSGWLRNERPTHISSITYIANPCKEFDSLNKYITTILKCKELKFDDIMRQGVSGKRSTIFDRYGTTLLAHNPEKCKGVKQALQKMKKQNWHAEISLKTDKYWGDRFNSYGEDMESEWDGTETSYAVVKFYTPNGKEVAKYEIWP